MTEELKKAVLDIFEGADQRNWTRVQNAMAENILLDYTSMMGGQPALLSPSDITNAWSHFLPGFDKTQHNLSNFKFDIKDDLIVVTFDGVADHFIDDRVWTVEGNYIVEIQKDNKVSLLKFNFKNQSGDTELPKLATENIQKR